MFQIERPRARGQILVAIALACACTLLVFPVKGQAADLGAAAGKSCAPAYFLGARGSGESGSKSVFRGMGKALSSQYDQLRIGLGLPDESVLAPLAVPSPQYPAVKVKDWSAVNLIIGKYADSVNNGADKALDQIDDLSRCKVKPKIILAGYSQGASVMRVVIQEIPSAQRSMIVGAIMLGDPGFDPNEDFNLGTYDSGHYGGLIGWAGNWPAWIKSKLYSVCVYADNVCNLKKKGPLGIYYNDVPQFLVGFGPHESYSQSWTYLITAPAINRFGLRSIIPKVAPKPATTTLPADVVFVIDTTGSMSGIINSVKASVASMAVNLASASSSFRVGLVEYKDDEDSPFQSRKVLDFTTDLTAFTAALGSLDADGGGDWPESVYSGLMTAFEMPFRPGVKKSVIAIGDAPPKDPEPITGFTANQVIAKSLSIDPAQVFVSFDGSALDPEDKTQLDKITNGTGGASFYDSTGGAKITDNVKAAIDKTGATPLLSMSVPTKAIPGKSYKFGAFVLAEENATKFDWDFNGDGVYDASTAAGSAAFAYPAAGAFIATVRATFADGRVAFGSSPVTAAPPINVQAPGKLKKLKSKLKGSTLTLTITLAKKGAPADQIVIVDKRGKSVGDVITKAKKSKYKVKVKNLKKGKFTWLVRAANDFGVSKPTKVAFRVKR